MRHTQKGYGFVLCFINSNHHTKTNHKFKNGTPLFPQYITNTELKLNAVRRCRHVFRVSVCACVEICPRV